MPDSISIIIPALNEAANLDRVLSSIPSHLEVILVDGGSEDGTIDIARAKGIKAFSCKPSRGMQMNLGAAHATGDTLLFLHADTTLPGDFAQQIETVLHTKYTVAGAFPLKIDMDSIQLRCLEKVVWWRSRFLQLPYGDQALFMPSQIFIEVGGFPEIPLMEDVALIKKIRKLGRIGLCQKPVITSGRRWRQLGLAKTTFVNLTTFTLYHLGVSPQWIARFYHRHRNSVPENTQNEEIADVSGEEKGLSVEFPRE
jgi:rSAM/selenodomain-associated transferase 2